MPDASEAARLRAASEAIDSLRRQRSAIRQTQSQQESSTTGSNSTPVKPDPTLSLPGSHRPTSRLAALHDSGDPTETAIKRSHERPTTLIAVAATTSGLVGLMLGFALSSGEPERTSENSSITTNGEMALLRSQNSKLTSAVASLEAETTELEFQLLQWELTDITTNSSSASVPIQSAPPSVNGTASLNLDTDTLNIADSFDTEPDNITNEGLAIDKAETMLERLAMAELDQAQLSSVATAFASAEEELAMIDADEAAGTHTWAEAESLRRSTREHLVATTGIESFVAGRHALGEPNRLTIAAIGDNNGTGPVIPGDVLLRVDGERVVDLQQLAWLDHDAGDRADDAGESSESHILHLLRDGQTVQIPYYAPLGQLVLEADSVAPSDLRPSS